MFSLSSSRKVAFALYGAVFLALILTITTIYFYTKWNDIAHAPSETEEVESLVAAVGRLIVLPPDEEPTIATVSNVEALRGQAFFRNAKDGDRVLIYSRAGRAILYDPVAHKIVEVAPINPGDGAASP